MRVLNAASCGAHAQAQGTDPTATVCCDEADDKAPGAPSPAADSVHSADSVDAGASGAVGGGGGRTSGDEDKAAAQDAPTPAADSEGDATCAGASDASATAELCWRDAEILRVLNEHVLLCACASVPSPVCRLPPGTRRHRRPWRLPEERGLTRVPGTLWQLQ